MWAEADERWGALVESVSLHGIRDPIKITARNEIVDGRHRWTAAQRINLGEVPVEVVSDDDVATIIIDSLLNRRHYTRSQMAYIAYPIVAPAHRELRAMHTSGLMAGNVRREAPRATSTVVEVAASFGISERLFQQAAQLHAKFEADPELRRKFEPSIFDEEKPAGLGAVLAGIGGLTAQAARGFHNGGRPQEVERQLELFAATVIDGLKRWEYWQGWDDETRKSYWREVRQHAVELPVEKCLEVAEYYSRLAEEFRKAGKEAR